MLATAVLVVMRALTTPENVEVGLWIALALAFVLGTFVIALVQLPDLSMADCGRSEYLKARRGVMMLNMIPAGVFVTSVMLLFGP